MGEGNEGGGLDESPSNSGTEPKVGKRKTKSTGAGELQLGSLVLRGEARVDRWEVKSAAHIDFPDPDQTPDYSGAEVIDPAKIVDLTSRLSPDGELKWDAPPGHWTILRFGHTATGAIIKHSRPESDGLECDKMSTKAAQVQFDNYVGKILKEVRSVPGAQLAGVMMDSMEQGSQNWTEDFATQFKERRGYDLLRYLPTMAGRVVGSSAKSDKFLFDVRRTCADLISDNYYGEFEQLCHSNHMTFMAQAPGIATCIPVDNMQAKGRTDIPMGEFWMSQPDGTLDCKEAASAAHIYGKRWAAAEAFTGSRGEATCELARELIVLDRTAAPPGEGLKYKNEGTTQTGYDKTDTRPVIPKLVQSMLSKYGSLLSAKSGAVKLVRV